MHEEEVYNYFDESILDFKEGSSLFEDKMPKVAENFFKFTDASFEAGSLDQKTKQLMALSISIYAKDEYCIMYHTKGAVDHGATEDEIMETIAVSTALGGGAAFSQGVTLAHDAYHYFSNTEH
ncbi:carboxymuconolactone decarboxylase family protein [Bacillaceae bacterium W0354]